MKMKVFIQTTKNGEYKELKYIQNLTIEPLPTTNENIKAEDFLNGEWQGELSFDELDTAIRNTEKELDELEKRVDKQLEKIDEIIKKVGINIDIPEYESELKITETFTMMTKKHFNRFQKFMFKTCFGIEVKEIDRKEG